MDHSHFSVNLGFAVMNPDLRRERANCPFEIEEITNLLNGGPQKTQLKRSILQKIIKSEVCQLRFFSAKT